VLWCSDPPYKVEPEHEKKVSMGTEVDPIAVAWAAGIFEGEGCFATFKNHQGRRYMGLQVNMCDEDVVQKLYDTFASIGGTFAPWHPPSHRNTGRQPQFRWRISGKRAEEVFWMMAPHLGRRRLSRFMELHIEISNFNEEIGNVA
jgi:hypothetical protein